MKTVLGRKITKGSWIIGLLAFGLLLLNPGGVLAVQGDLDGDGKGDLVWRNTTTGAVAVWLMNGPKIKSSGFFGVPLEWTMQGIGDVDNNGKEDIIWKHTSGTVAIWQMNGLTISGVGFPGRVSSDWLLKGVADVNGDEKADLIWRNTESGVVALWLMNGTSIASSGFLGGVPPEWVLAGTGDVDGNGNADILWRNNNSGVIAIWLLNGLTIHSVGFPGSASLNWIIRDVGDLDGNGTADILWQNAISGGVAVWLMNGTSIATSGFLGGVPVGWELVGTRDVNGDGKGDAIWRNLSSGVVAGWLMDGLTISAMGFPGSTSLDYVSAIPLDNDGDGFIKNQGDCDDKNAEIHPGAEDTLGNEIDENCDGEDGNKLNNAPSANAGPDQISDLDETVLLDGNKSFDPDSDPLNFSWFLVDKPIGSAANLSDSDTPNPSFILDLPGTYVIGLRVSDGLNESRIDTVTVTDPIIGREVKKGVFLGEPVEGLEFRSADLTGVTGQNGIFEYKIDSNIQFFIGGIVLGSAIAKPIITPMDLIRETLTETTEFAVNIARFLETLDNDANTENGIKINEEVRRLAIDMSINFKQGGKAFEDDTDVQKVIEQLTALAGVGTRKLVPAEVVRQRLERTLLGIFKGSYKGTLSDEEDGTWTINVDEAGIITGSGISEKLGNFEVVGNLDSNGLFESIWSAGTADLNVTGIISESGLVSGNWISKESGRSGTMGGVNANQCQNPTVNNPCVVINKVWSDQFPNSQANFLPNGSGKRNRPYILVGARENALAYLKARITILPDDPLVKEKVRVQLAEVLGGQPQPQNIQLQGVGSFDGSSVASMWVRPPDSIKPFRVVAWVDFNNNGGLDDGEPFKVFGNILPISKKLYFDLKDFMELEVSEAKFFGLYPDAASFMLAFLQDRGPSGSRKEATLSLSEVKPDHNVGVDFGESRTGKVFEYVFNSGSTVTAKLLQSDEIQGLLIGLLKGGIEKVQNFFKCNSEENSGKLEIEVSFFEDKRLRFNSDGNLFRTFGTPDVVTLKLTANIVRMDTKLILDSLEVKGFLSDLYDWYFEEDGFRNAWGASVQAGYGTLGKAGHIFKSKVLFDNTLNTLKVPINFGSSEGACEGDGDGGGGGGGGGGSGGDGDGGSDDDTKAPDPTFIQVSKSQEKPRYRFVTTSNTEALVAKLSVPYENSMVRGEVPIFGLAYGENFKEYQVQFGKGDRPTEWQTVVISSIPQTKAVTKEDLDDSAGLAIHGNLATWDTGLKNYVYLPSHPANHPIDLKGTYTIRLVVTGTDGSTTEDRVTVHVGNVIPNAWGGRVVSSDQNVILIIPEQAIMDSFRLMLIQSTEERSLAPSNGRRMIGSIYEVREPGERFTKPATLQMIFSEEDLGQVRPDQLGIYGYNSVNGKWEYLKSSRSQRESIVFTRVSTLHSHYALMASSLPTEGSVVETSAEPMNMVYQVRQIHPGDQYLVQNTFEENLGDWTNRDGVVGGAVSLDDSKNADGNKSLKITNTNAGGNFAVNVYSEPFDAREFPIIQFDYRIVPEVKTNWLVKVGGRWYEIGFTDDPKDLKNQRVNIAHIGDIEGVFADDGWHTATFNLHDMLRTKTRHTQVEEMIMADWDVGGYMKLQFGHNKQGATYYIDNFLISRSHSPGINVTHASILIDDFNQKPLANSSGGMWNTFADGVTGTVDVSFHEDDAFGQGYALELAYDVSKDRSFAGFLKHLPRLDLRDFDRLSLWVRGGKSGQDLLVGLKDTLGNESKVLVSRYLGHPLSPTWQEINIPLTAFTEIKDWGQVELLSFSFDHIHNQTGIFFVDQIQIQKGFSTLLVDNFERTNDHNALGLPQYTYARGAATVEGKRVQNSPNGVYRLSYSVDSGKIKPTTKEPKSFAGWASPLSGINCSRCETLEFRLRGEAGGENATIYLDDGNFRWGLELAKFVDVTTDWQKVTIPIDSYAEAGVDMTHLDKIHVVFEGGEMSGTIYLDDIQLGEAVH